MIFEREIERIIEENTEMVENIEQMESDGKE